MPPCLATAFCEGLLASVPASLPLAFAAPHRTTAPRSKGLECANLLIVASLTP